MINPAHKYAVFEYNDQVEDKYYVGKRFISANDVPGEDYPAKHKMFIVATADTTEELQQYLDHSPRALMAWLLHQRREIAGVFGDSERATKEDEDLLTRLGVV